MTANVSHDDGHDGRGGQDDESVNSAVLQVRIRLTLAPECADRSLQVPTDIIAVPADAGRKKLSAIINHLLDRKLTSEDEEEDEDDGNDDSHKLPAISFECIIGRTNRLLRTGLEREARRSGLSLEEAISITYFPAQQAPETSGESDPLPDWIAAMSYVPERHVLCTGCYDGSIQVFRDDGEDSKVTMVATKTLAHKGPIHCLSATTTAEAMGSEASIVWIATGSMDHTLQLHQLDPTNALSLYASCQGGHTSAITSIDLNNNAMSLASGDWDGNLCIWNLTQEPVASEEENATPIAKKTKTTKEQSGSVSAKSTTSLLSPTSSTRAHSSNISGISWGNFALRNRTSAPPLHLTTASWDHSIKVWDVTRQDCLLTLNVSRVVTCLDTSYHSDGIVATGHADCTIRLWDTRTGVLGDAAKDAASLVVADTTFLPSHKEWITAVQWSRDHPFHLASTSHDGTVKLWDIRSALPLHTYRAFPKKVKGLSLSYGHGDGVTYVGGADCVVKQLHCADVNASNQIR
jgi:ribosome biogenesis protein